ncbi:hypothetical protein NE237_012870 [Protea cynaroides]|uniref:Uncharacterized protein n=1 Tax=Protea cynaroides TaxID=273540 RepID=A0A9Q0JYH2_9MAGN|nr:hypothetical protein NE237_012870 [Protea cynaroides]
MLVFLTSITKTSLRSKTLKPQLYPSTEYYFSILFRYRGSILGGLLQEGNESTGDEEKYTFKVIRLETLGLDCFLEEHACFSQNEYGQIFSQISEEYFCITSIQQIQHSFGI